MILKKSGLSQSNGLTGLRPNIARNEMNREQHEYELAASHARGEAEDRHNERMRLMREIDELMELYVRPIIKGEK